jgi:diketogulonate reductase-like aldo/keto reductase
MLTETNNTPRSSIYITSKLKTNRNYDRTLADLRRSLKESHLDYFDLYLMHSAIGGPAIRKQVWQACIDAKKEGLVKSIGVRGRDETARLRANEPRVQVSNFGSKHIQEFVHLFPQDLPTVNQVDLHPFMQHPDIVAICEKHKIVLEVGRLWLITTPFPCSSGITVLTLRYQHADRNRHGHRSSGH